MSLGTSISTSSPFLSHSSSCNSFRTCAPWGLPVNVVLFLPICSCLSCFFTIFVHPDYQGKGIGRLIIGTLERDDFYLRAKRIEVPASITAVPFYLKMGYAFKGGVTEPDEEQLLRLEKHRLPCASGEGADIPF